MSSGYIYLVSALGDRLRREDVSVSVSTKEHATAVKHASAIQVLMHM